MTSLYLAWQDSQSRRWFPIGILKRVADDYRFAYLQAVEKARDFGFTPIPSFPKFDQQYYSEEIFPLFANRLLNRSRPEYETYLSWLDLPSDQEHDNLELLARSGGRRVTDSFAVFPEFNDLGGGRFSERFFVHGLRHMPAASAERAERLEQGERLFLLHDFQNPHDPCALMVRSPEKTDGDVFPLGYGPRYLFADSFERMTRDSEWPKITVERVNPAPAPVSFRLLCRAEFLMPEGEKPLGGRDFQEYVDRLGRAPVSGD